MYFSTLFSLIATSYAAAVPDGEFGLVTIHSGSEFHYSAVKLASDGHWSLNGETDLHLALENGNLKANGQGVDLISGFPVVKTDGTYGGDVWGVKDSDLTFADGTGFYICPDNNNNIAVGKFGPPSTCTNAVGVTLYKA